MSIYNQRTTALRPAPNCSRFGLRWSEATQRCEKPRTIAELINDQKRRGLGFAEPDYYFDEYGNYWDRQWFSPDEWSYFTGGGGGGQDLPYIEMEWPVYMPEPGPSAGNPFELLAEYFNNWFYGNVDAIDTADPYALPQWQGEYRLPDLAPYGDISPVLYPGPGPANLSFDAPVLPGYCPQGQYHPIDAPLTCVPFPANDQAAKRSAQQQRQQAQAQARAARSAQNQQNQQCPKDPRGRPVWRNPKTGRCELVPTCPQGSRFDQVTNQCLTPTQQKGLYGSSNWWIWVIIGTSIYLVATRRQNDSYLPRGRRR